MRILQFPPAVSAEPPLETLQRMQEAFVSREATADEVRHLGQLLVEMRRNPGYVIGLADDRPALLDLRRTA